MKNIQLPRLASNTPRADFFEDEDSYLPPDSRLIEKRQYIKDAEKQLQNQKVLCHQRRLELKIQEEQLHSRTAELRLNIQKFDSFLRENESKKARAAKKTWEERKLRDGKERELQTMKDKLESLNSEVELQKKRMSLLLPYQSFLDSVVENTGDDYSEIRDVIARYETLHATHQDLISRSKLAHERSDQIRFRLQTLNREKNDLILEQNNELVHYQAQLESLRLRTQAAQENWDRVMSSSTQKSLTLGQIRMASNNLYQTVRNHQKQQVEQLTNPLAQLDRIEKFVNDLEDVVGKVLRSVAKSKHEKSNVVPVGKKETPRQELPHIMVLKDE